MAFCADDASGSDEAAAGFDEGPGPGAADEPSAGLDEVPGPRAADEAAASAGLDEGTSVTTADVVGPGADAPERPGPGAGDFTQFSPPSLPLPRTILDGLTMSIRSLLRSDLGFVWLPVGSWPRTVRGSGLTIFREVSETA